MLFLRHNTAAHFWVVPQIGTCKSNTLRPSCVLMYGRGCAMCQGDLGDAVHALASGTGQHGRQTRLVQPPRLTVASLLRAFRAMAGSTGQVRHTCRHAQSVVVLRSPHSLCGDPTVRQSTGISPAQAAWCCEAVPIRVNQAFILACSSTPAVRQPCEWCCQRCQKQGRPSHRSPIPDADTRSRAAYGCELDTSAHSSRTRRRVAAV